MKLKNLVLGDRQTGKTETIIKKIIENGKDVNHIILVPNVNIGKYIQMRIETNYDLLKDYDIAIIPFKEFACNRGFRLCHNTKIYVDDIDACIISLIDNYEVLFKSDETFDVSFDTITLDSTDIDSLVLLETENLDNEI